ncbi:MAG: ureidoglycolate hydrolase [Proteobacteria bacterium]|nr:MAG: ureidoglycolate hydrolase [Pseudomonadota bacterium]
MAAPDYLNPAIPRGLARVRLPMVDATDENIAPYGYLVDDPEERGIEIRRWPASGRRPVDPDSGDEGGTTEGVFHGEWRGDILYGRNEAVGGHYILGYGAEPACATDGAPKAPERILLWHANYHPDGAQLFFPLDPGPFVAPLALPGDDVRPQDFICFRFDGSRGLYIHPDIWHEGVFPLGAGQRFFDRQGAVHARVSVDFAREFHCLLEVDPAA